MNIHDLQLHFSIRKLSVGVVSCLIGICFISSNQTVQADSMSIASNNKSVIISNSSSNSNPTETKSSNKQDIVDSNNTSPTQIDSHSNQNSTKSNPTETIASKSNNKQNIVDSNNTSPTQINSHSNQNSTKTTLVNFKLKVSSQQPAAADSAENKLETAALNPTIDEKLDAKMLAESKATAQAKDTNGGFDKATWGTLNVNNWKGGVQGDYYQLTDYTGDANHVIVPNEADFAKAGISTSGKQVGVTSALMHTIFKKANTNDATVAFSKTNNETVKAIGSDWSDTWGHSQSGDLKAKLSKFDGTNLDVSNVTNMSGMFTNNHISDLSPLANWNVGHVKDMIYMFASNQISDLKPLTYWNDSNVTDMRYMFYNNQISDLSPLAKWNVSNVTNMIGMFKNNRISDLSPLANWDVNNAHFMSGMFDNNSSIIQTKETPTERVINFVYPAGYTGKKQYSVTQTVYVQRELRVELTTKNPRPSTFNSILEWVTKTETPETPDPVYFQDYTVPKIKGLLEPDKTVISKQQADVNKPINVTVTYKLVDSNTNDVFALDSKHGLHEHANVNDNGGYDADYWGKINVDDWDYTVNNDRIEINGLKDGVSTGANDAVIVPNLDDFKLAGKDGGAKAVYISKNTLSKTAWHEYYGLSKTNGSKFVTDSDLNNAFNNSNLTHADLNSLNTSNVTDMSSMFNGARSLTDLDVSNWKTGNVTNMSNMFNGASRLASLDVSNWDTGNVTDMSSMFNGASSLTDLDVSNWKTGNVTNMSNMFNRASRLASLDVSNWDTGNVTNMSWMFNGASRLALIANSGKFADYLVKNNFAYSGINSDVKSVTTDNTKLLKLLTNDIVKSESATRTIVFTFPANYSPDLAKYHLTKVNNIYQIKQSADYDNSYVQGTVLINATGKHRIDTTKPYKLSDTWQPNYDKLVLAHKNADGTVSFDNVQLPKVPGYKAKVNRNNGLLMVSYLVFAPEKPETNNNLNELQFSNKLATNSTVQFNSAVKSNIIVKSDMYQVVNDDHNWQLPVIKSYDLKFATNKNQIIFAYTKDKQYNYRFVLTFKDGQYRLTTFDKQGKLLKTYSIKSYKKLAKIIHSLVSMNIA